jgi:hypothetical protein
LSRNRSPNPTGKVEISPSGDVMKTNPHAADDERGADYASATRVRTRSMNAMTLLSASRTEPGQA